MTRTTFTNDEIFHRFAAQSQDYGKTGNGNVFFQGPVVFSYGAHYPIARIMDDGETVLFNATPSSVTTERHKSKARQALRHLNFIELPELDKVLDMLKVKQRRYDGWKAALKSDAATYLKGVHADVVRLQESRGRMRAPWKIANSEAQEESLCRAASFVWHDVAGRRGDPFKGMDKIQKERADGLARARFTRSLATLEHSKNRTAQQFIADLESDKQTHYATFSEDDSARVKIAVSHRFIEHVERRATAACVTPVDCTNRKEARRIMGAEWLASTLALQEELKPRNDALLEYLKGLREEHKRNVIEWTEGARNAWLAGESNVAPYGAMCLRIKDDELQTSQGARVPLPDAIRLTFAAVHCRETGTAWKRNGQTKKVGVYQTDRILTDGTLQVGCHVIPFEAIRDCVERFAPILPGKLVASVRACRPETETEKRNAAQFTYI